MDKAYLKQILDRLVAERAIHDDKFAGNPAHQDCQPRFERVIDSLRKDLGQEQPPRLDFSITESALPDAILEAPVLERAAEALQLEKEHQTAAALKMKATEIVMHEMNELDGFDR